MSVTSLLRNEMVAAMAAAAVLGLLMLALRPGDRASTRNALALLAVCALVEIAYGLIPSTGGWRAASIAVDAASVLVGVVLIRIATMFVFRVVLPALGLHGARIVEDLATAALYVTWALVWLRLSGVDLASLVATSAVITAVLAFSMQETLGNVLGGIVMQVDRSIRVGDWVRVEQAIGRVVEIGWRHTAIETRDRETMIVPNGWLVKNRFTVIGSRADPRTLWRRWVRVNVDLGAAPGEVCRVLEEAARGAIAHVAGDPPPNAVLLEFGARYGSYALRYWLDDPQPDDATDSQVRMHVLAALERHGMKLGAPYQEQFDIRDDESHREERKALERRRRIEALERVELFGALSAAERESLAAHLVYAPFAAGDVMTRQGAIAHWLYLVISGEADVWYEGPAGRSKVNTLAAGSVFGEMGMMTGEPRRATVTARTDVVCYRLDKAGFESILRARPDVAEAISRVLSSREGDLRGRREAATHEGHGVEPQDAILARIRRFFGIDA
ncbi:MAG: cyclic nucleotide-binding domain-containing protein [Usitatibacter sp.]